MTHATAQSEAVLNYVQRCADASANPDSEPQRWTYLEGRLEVDDDFTTTLSRELGLNSSLLDPSSDTKAKIELVPCPYRAADGSAVREVEISSFGSTRVVKPVPIHTLESLAGAANANQMEKTDSFVCLPLGIREFLSAPTVRLRYAAQGTQGAALLSVNRYLPVSEVTAKFADEKTPDRLAISLPDYATADFVALSFTVDLKVDPSSIDRAAIFLATVKPEDVKSPKALMAMAKEARNALMSIGTDVHAVFSQLASIVEGGIANNPIQGPFRNRKRLLRRWAGDILDARDELSTWLTGHGNHPTPSEVVDCAVKLHDIVQKYHSVKFVCPFALDGTGAVDLSPIKGVAEGDEAGITCTHMNAPFTTEREPSTQGAASTLLLIFLGAVLMLMSALSWLWLPVWVPLPSFPFGASPDMINLRSAIVTVLVLFPAALYGQFFQSRPKSPAGIKAQLPTFALLSTLFALPVVPAAWIAIGGGATAAGAMLAAGGIAAITLGVITGFVMSPANLIKLRVRSVRAVKPAPSLPAPRIV